MAWLCWCRLGLRSGSCFVKGKVLLHFREILEHFCVFCSPSQKSVKVNNNSYRHMCNIKLAELNYHKSKSAYESVGGKNDSVQSLDEFKAAHFHGSQPY